MRKANLPYFRDFPIDFRKRDIDAIKNAIQQNLNLQFVGAKGSGKSLTFRALQKLNPIDNTEIFLVDFNLIPEKSSLSVLNLIWGAMNAWQSTERATEGEIIIKIQNKFNQVEKDDRRVLFLFDSFENLTGLNDKLILNSLGSLIDANRDLLTCIFSLERPVTEKILGTYAEIYQVAMLSKTDFEWFTEGLEKAHSKTLTQNDKDLIFTSSSGFMAIAKRLFEACIAGEDLQDVIDNPEKNIHLRYQLDIILENNENIDIPILKNYGKKHSLDNEKLTASEFKLFSYLKENEHNLCSREDIITNIWGKTTSARISDHALDQLIHRLKGKLNGSGIKIETVRGRGHKMLD